MWDRSLNYGPNTDQVRRFLAILEQLNSDEWTAVGSYQWPGTSPETLNEAGAALSSQSRGWARWIGSRAGQSAPGPGAARDRADTAAEALAIRDALEQHFSVLYAPFHAVVPLECIEADQCIHERHG
ncbi:MAG: hypothetical protein ABR564_07065 [Candidatus Dormibacteria bacterium]